MNSLWLIIISIVIFLIAYTTYGSWLAKSWGIDVKRKVPSHTREDGVDYVPAKAPVVLGHHFSSIAGAGPIVGPIAAAMFGWLPVVLWIVIGSVFFGGVHDMGSLFASVRHEGKSIGQVINSTIGRKGKKLFEIFAWLTLILVVAAFTNIVAAAFVSTPEAATSSILFIVLAIVFGIGVYRRGLNLLVGTVIGVILLGVCVWLGALFPLNLSLNTWMIILLGYIFIASITPVWILLQPRDYLNSFLLYAMLIGGVLGLLLFRPDIQLAAYTGFKVGTNYMFPILFITVACGAISGFHSLVGSGTTSKQINSEADIKPIGYGSMLIEGILAILAIITAAYLTGDQLAELTTAGGALNVFSDGLGTFMSSIGIPFLIAKNFVTLAISAFALTSLDTATRLARFIFQEFFESDGKTAKNIGFTSILTNKYLSTLITVVLGGALAFKGYKLVWPIFGSANQLLAALALLALALWLKRSGRKYKMALYPMLFMFAATLSALVLLMKTNLANPILLIFAVVLFILAIVLIFESRAAFRSTEKRDRI